ncbi:MAG TPA: hypothetical protein VFG50_06945 [Rhodothermales bacterium]|nr:hypothetical protein [Rhodothermales bacterium]
MGIPYASGAEAEYLVVPERYRLGAAGCDAMSYSRAAKTMADIRRVWLRVMKKGRSAPSLGT